MDNLNLKEWVDGIKRKLEAEIENESKSRHWDYRGPAFESDSDDPDTAYRATFATHSN